MAFRQPNSDVGSAVFRLNSSVNMETDLPAVMPRGYMKTSRPETLVSDTIFRSKGAYSCISLQASGVSRCMKPLGTPLYPEVVRAMDTSLSSVFRTTLRCSSSCWSSFGLTLSRRRLLRPLCVSDIYQK